MAWNRLPSQKTNQVYKPHSSITQPQRQPQPALIFFPLFTAHTFSFSYATMSNCRCNSVHLFVLTILLLNSGQTLCHTKGLRTRNPRVVQPMMNASRVQFSEQQFMKWVTFVGSLKHSVFKAAKNKIFPSYTLIVAKNPSAGDFTTIQEAIDSLPFINLVRVIIKIRAGVYK